MLAGRCFATLLVVHYCILEIVFILELSYGRHRERVVKGSHILLCSVSTSTMQKLFMCSSWKLIQKVGLLQPQPTLGRHLTIHMCSHHTTAWVDKERGGRSPLPFDCFSCSLTRLCRDQLKGRMDRKWVEGKGRWISFSQPIWLLS